MTSEPQPMPQVGPADRCENPMYSGKALTHLPSHLLFWVVAALVLALDLWSKDWVFANLHPSETRGFITGFLEFRRSLNDGAVFGSFTGQVKLFIVASIFALGFVFYLFAQSPRTSHGLHIALAFIIAGAIGNLHDRARVQADVLLDAQGKPLFIGKIVEQDDEVIRIGAWPEGAMSRTYSRSSVTVRQQGVVRDFLKFAVHFPAWVPKLGGKEVWPWVFNIADAALVCGVGALICTSWLRRDPAAKA